MNVDQTLLGQVANSAVQAAMARTPRSTLRGGTVVTSIDGDVLVVLDGDTAPVHATALVPEPAQSDRVMVLLQPPSGAFVIGYIGDSRERWGEGGTGGGGDQLVSFTFQQPTPSAQWVINHPLAYFPAVTIVDSTGTQVEADVSYGAGQVVATFSAAFSGLAYLS